MSWDVVCEACGLVMDKSDDCRHADLCTGEPRSVEALIAQVKALVSEKNEATDRYRSLRRDVESEVKDALRNPKEHILAFNLQQILKETP